MSLKNSFLTKSNVILYILVIFVLVTAFYFYFKTRTNALAESMLYDDQVTLLFVIHDNDRPLVSSAFIYNNQTKRGALFDIPGSIGRTFSNLGKVDRIDSVFDAERPDAYLNVVQQLLGLPKPPFYLFFDLKQISFWVDMLNGLEIFIASSMVQQTNDYTINLPAGNVLLDGETVVQFLRYTNANDSVNSQIDRRHKFMQAFINKLSHSSTLLKNRYVQPYVVQESNSNLQKSALNLLWNELAIFDSDNLTWKNIAGAVRQIDGQTLLFPYYDGNIVKETVTQTIALLKDSEQISADLWIRKIAIQNGTERNGLAAQAARRFESMGFSVAEISNAPSADVLYTVVLDVSGNLEQARRVADVIRCTRVYSVVQADDDDGQSFDGVQVILGRDFDGQYVRQISFEGE